MNFIDILICIPLVWGLYKGFTKGLILEAASFIAFGCGVWGGIYFSNSVEQKIIGWSHWHSPYLPIISFAITFLGIVMFIYFFAKIVQRILEGMALGAINKIGGALFGSLKYALVLSVLIFVIDAVEKSYPVISFKAKEGSVLYKPVGKIASFLIPALNKNKAGELNDLFTQQFFHNH